MSIAWLRSEALKPGRSRAWIRPSSRPGNTYANRGFGCSAAIVAANTSCKTKRGLFSAGTVSKPVRTWTRWISSDAASVRACSAAPSCARRSSPCAFAARIARRAARSASRWTTACWRPTRSWMRPAAKLMNVPGP